ncbi:MAG: DUF2484 family protein [Albidovulum sp.]
MSWPLLAAAIWALAATFTAFLPMRLQYPPGITLLILAPVILIWIGVAHGVFWALLGTAGFLSMFRKPLIYFGRKALSGHSSSDPKP